MPAVNGPIYIFCGGGSGGHLYPGLAVADELLNILPEARVVFACSSRAIDRRILGPLKHGMVVQPVVPLPRRLRDVGAFIRAWLRSRSQAREMLKDLRAAAVLGLGGFAAAPVVRQAARAGVPTALLNPDAVPGRANRYLARYARVIFTQFSGTRQALGDRAGKKVRHVGCPLRRGFSSADHDDACARFGLDPQRKTLLVNGGSQGAASINEAVFSLRSQLNDLADKWQLLHITGAVGMVEPAGRDDTGPLHAVVLEYCDRMDLAYAAADLALGRCGASTAAELAVTNTPAVILPYPYHADRQQRRNAEPLEEAGAAIICEDATDAAANAETLTRYLMPLLGDAGRLEGMRKAAASLARPDAAKTVAQWLARFA